METAAVLKRVSTDLTRQDVRNQDADVDRVIGDSGLTVARTFEIEASAYHGEHAPVLDQIKADVKAGLYSVVVIAMTSRIERRGHRTLLRFIWDLADLGARVIAADNPMFGTDGIMGDMASMFAANSDHEYSKKISENVTRAFARSDKDNAFRGVAPTGYHIVGDKGAKALVPSDGVCRCANNTTDYHKRCLITASQVAEAIKSCAAGTSTTALGKQLGMTPDAVGKMIRNPVYSTGRYEIKRSDGSIYVHHCEALVQPEVQRAAIAALEARRTGDNVTSRSIAKEDFSGAVWCALHQNVDGTAGRGMYRYYGGKEGKRTRRYRCGTCGASVKADAADKAINDLMGSQEDWWLRVRIIPGDDHAAELARLQDELDHLGQRRLSRAEHRAESDRLYDEIERLEGLPSVPARTVAERVRNDNGNLLSEGDHWNLMDMRERRAWLLSRAASSQYPVVKAAAGRTGSVTAELMHVPDEEWPEGKEVSK